MLWGCVMMYRIYVDDQPIGDYPGIAGMDAMRHCYVDRPDVLDALSTVCPDVLDNGITIVEVMGVTIAAVPTTQIMDGVITKGRHI